MYLKSLTLRGFKSFASATTLRFESGITCVVGPNGSGKSNVVDALAWVMGEQGAKSLRGGKMEDVVFAGTASRPPLGRAEVTLTIDNGDGALPIDYSEVTISRLMFRSGQSEYSINGDSCRLLDVQELLSDSGIGREMHVIVGQGQLDAVLHAGPEERRSFIEEAAGILKHRKRKEKALRKLEAMQGNLTRLQDLTGELRRQLKPLGRQAEAARRAAVVQAELRDARLRLLADDIVGLRETLRREEAQENAVRERRASVESALARARARETDLDTTTRAESAKLAEAQDTWYRLSALRERLHSVKTLASERHRHLSVPPDEDEERRGRDPDELAREAEAVQAQEETLNERLDEAQAALGEAVRDRTAAEAALAEEERRIAAVTRAAADRREGLAKLRGQVEALRSRSAAAEQEISRLRGAAADAGRRAAGAEAQYAAVEDEIGGLDDGGEGDGGPESAHRDAEAALADANGRVAASRRDLHETEREQAALAARKDALQQHAVRGDASSALLSASEWIDGLLGQVAALMTVQPGAETGIAAALGDASEAVAVGSLDAALTSLEYLKEADAGRAGLLVGRAQSDPADPDGPTDLIGPAGPGDPAPAAPPGLPPGAKPALSCLSVPPELTAAVRWLLADVVVVDDLGTARAVVDAHPSLRAVTRDGDLVGAHWVRGGSASAPGPLEAHAAMEETSERLDAVVRRAERIQADLARALGEAQEAEARVADTRARLEEANTRRAAATAKIRELGATARAARGEAERAQEQIIAAEEARDRDLEGLAALEERLAQAEAAPADESEPSTLERDRLAARCHEARTAEMDARLTVRTAEERARAIAGRADSLRRAAEREREARARAASRRERRTRHAAVARAVALGAEVAVRHAEASLQAADDERRDAERRRTAHDAELRSVREELRDLSDEMERLVGAVHGREVNRAEQRLRLEQLTTRAVDEFGIEVEPLIGEYGPDVPVPPSPDAPEDAVPTPFRRDEQEQRAAAAERRLQRLGKVNPLALEEYAALEERHAFLTAQLEDLKKTRRDLLTVVKEVDDRVEQVFTAAFHDTAREFEDIFCRLFPGGYGRLVLTDPDDMLTSGVDVEARPPGKKIKRLSLLSGGERSLTAIAFLVAIFKARPSPFYVLDEVEAALDDTNLQRVLTVFEELRKTSQLIIITHQKRTMEIADALYGVSMRGDGVTAVISQRLREAEPV